jgi:hypothetical protein
MADGVHVRTHPVKQEMHRQLRGDFAIPRKMPPVQVRYHQIFGSKHPLIHASGRGENPAVFQPHGSIAIASHNVFSLIHPPPGDADVAAVLFFALRVALQK